MAPKGLHSKGYMIVHFKFFLALFIICICTLLQGQQNLLDKEVYLTDLHLSVEDHLLQLEVLGEVQISFSSNQVQLDNIVLLTRHRQSLSAHLKEILKNQDLTYVNTLNNRIVIKPDDSPKWYKLTGTIHDDISGDPLAGVVVRNIRTRDVNYSDEDGFFSIRVSNQNDSIGFALIGYSSLTDTPEVKRHQHKKYFMTSDNIIPLVLITGAEIDNDYTGIPGQRFIRPRDIASYSSFLGDNNLDLEIRNLASVQSGNEGQSGFFVRGGSSDQNLILYEGVPLYESSHTAGLSSIFITDAVKDIMIYNDAFPARYGGRLSSVMNVRLKSGKSDSLQGSFSAALTGATLQLNGPFKNKRFSYNVSGRMSWINLYIDPILRNAFSYNQSDIGYSDLNAKIHCDLSPSSNVSISYYKGSDNIQLDRKTSTPTETGTFENYESTLIGWQNQLLALNYTNVLNEKWFLKAHISGLGYNYQTRGSYRFINDITDSVEVDIISFSKINDINANTDLTYHRSEHATFKMGTGRIVHQFNPTIKQSTIIRDINPIEVIDGDSTILANESYYYVEGIFHPNKKINIATGIRQSSFEVRGKKYAFTEPRFSFSIFPQENHRLNFAFSQMAQYHHRLVNPSLGLPSDLWVPSTENIKPEFSTLLSLSYSTFKKDNYSFSLAGYYKTMENLLEYSNSYDPFYAIVQTGSFIPNFNTSSDWERRVSEGTGRSRGIEMSLSKTLGKSKIGLTYARSKSTRKFDDIDGGVEFFHTFDRTHDLNFSANIRLSQNWDLAISWVYGTGNAFTLALEEYPTPDGLIVVAPTNRNNTRLPPFHHLDLTANYLIQSNLLTGKFSFGIYNVYNRLNPYYAYLYSPPGSDVLRLRQISLFPFLPHISFKTSW